MSDVLTNGSLLNNDENQQDSSPQTDPKQGVESPVTSSIGSDQTLVDPAEVARGQSEVKAMTCSSPRCLVVMAAVFAAVGGLLFGYDTGIISGALLQLRTEFSLSCQQAELVVSSLMIGAVLAAIVTGPIVDKFGRRLAIICNSLVFVVGTLIQAAAVNYTMLIVGRLMIGFGVSLSATAECIYIAEISPVEKRGFLVSLNEFSIAAGFLLAYLVGFLFIDVTDGWRYMFALAVIPAIVQGAGMIFMPPSPRFLVLKGEDAKAKSVLKQIREASEVDSELREIERTINAERNLGYRELFSMKDNMLGRLLIGIGIVLLQQLTGQPNALYYAPMIFEMLGANSASAASLSTVGLGVIKVIFTGIALYNLDRFGRRKGLLTGTSLMLVGMLALGIVSLVSEGQFKVLDPCLEASKNSTDATMLRKTSEGNSTLSLAVRETHNDSVKGTVERVDNSMELVELWVTLLALMTFVAGYAVGFGPASWLILSEIFPASIRGRALSLAIIFNWLSNLLVSLTFLEVISSIGVSTTFLIYAAVCLLSIFYIWCLVPETKDRTLEEITATLQQWTFKRRIKETLCCKETQTNPDYQPLDVEMSTPWIPSVR